MYVGVRYVWCRQCLWFLFVGLFMFISKLNVLIFCLCRVFCFFTFSYQLSFWTLTVVVDLSFKLPGLQRNSFPSTLLQVIIYFFSFFFWNESILCVIRLFVFFLSCWVWNAFFSGGISYCFWLLCYFFPLHNRRKCNNELGLPHQDGGNIFLLKTIVGDREKYFSYTFFYPYNTKLWMRSKTFYLPLHSTLSGQAQAV